MLFVLLTVTVIQLVLIELSRIIALLSIVAKFVTITPALGRVKLFLYILPTLLLKGKRLQKSKI